MAGSTVSRKGGWLATVPGTGDRIQAKEFKSPSLTKQSFKEECSIAYMVEKFGIKEVPKPMEHFAFFGDATAVTDLAEATAFVKSAEDQFDALPAGIREYFDNDPVLLVEFMQDPENREEGIELGIIKPSDAERQMAAAPAAPTEPEAPQSPPPAEPAVADPGASG